MRRLCHSLKAEREMAKGSRGSERKEGGGVGEGQIFKTQVFPKQKGLIKADVTRNIVSAILELTSTYSSISGGWTQKMCFVLLVKRLGM